MIFYRINDYFHKYNKIKRKQFGYSLVEVMFGIIIFALIFVVVFRAFAPTATASHNLVRGTTIAMNACNWYLNSLEQAIQYEGALSSTDLGEHDITNQFSDEQFSDIKLLRSLKVTSLITLKDNLYTAKITFNWGDSENGKEKSHHFEMYRLIVQPNL